MKMKALVLNGPGDFEYTQRERPVRADGEVLVRTRAVCICGSDIHAIRGNQKMFSFPRVIGHEVCVEVLEAAPGSGFSAGDLACLLPCISCGACIACRKGKTNCCKSLRLYGVHEDGGLQEYLSLPESALLKISFSGDPVAIAAIEPHTIGAHAAAKLETEPGESVLVLGAGPIGVSCALMAQSYGADVMLAEISEARREFAAERFALRAVDPREADGAAQFDAFTDGEGFHGVIDTTANKSSMEHAYRYLGQGGRLVYVGVLNGKLELDEAAFHMVEPTLAASRNSTAGDYRRVLDLWRQGTIDPARLVTDTVAFADAGNAILGWAKSGSTFKGVVLF